MNMTRLRVYICMYVCIRTKFFPSRFAGDDGNKKTIRIASLPIALRNGLRDLHDRLGLCTILVDKAQDEA